MGDFALAADEAREMGGQVVYSGIVFLQNVAPFRLINAVYEIERDSPAISSQIEHRLHATADGGVHNAKWVATTVGRR